MVRLVDDPTEDRTRAVVDLPVFVAVRRSGILSLFFRRHTLKERGRHVFVRERRARAVPAREVRHTGHARHPDGGDAAR
jgi:hypothetical protein